MLEILTWLHWFGILVTHQENYNLVAKEVDVESSAYLSDSYPSIYDIYKHYDILQYIIIIIIIIFIKYISHYLVKEYCMAFTTKLTT